MFSTFPETPAAKDATLLITVVSDGQAREGVAVDVMVNGKVVNVGTTDAKGQVIVHAKEGDKVDYRVASVPAGYEAPKAASATLKAGENTAQITVNKAGSTTPTDNKPVEPTKPEIPTEAATFTLSVVDSASKAPLSGVAIDLMVAGKVTTATTDAKGQVAVSAKAGDVVKHRVAVTPTGYKSNTVAYDATLVKGENTATLALEAEGTTPTPTPNPEPTPKPKPTPTPQPDKKDDGMVKPATDKIDDGKVKSDVDKKGEAQSTPTDVKKDKKVEDKKAPAKLSSETKSKSVAKKIN